MEPRNEVLECFDVNSTVGFDLRMDSELTSFLDDERLFSIEKEGPTTSLRQESRNSRLGEVCLRLLSGQTKKFRSLLLSQRSVLPNVKIHDISPYVVMTWGSGNGIGYLISVKYPG